jgi:hypothetical protein
MALPPSTPAVQALVFPHPKSVADPFVLVYKTKNPAYVSVSRVCENLFFFLPAYLQPIRIDRDFPVSFGQTKAKHTTGLAMTCRLRD